MNLHLKDHTKGVGELGRILLKPSFICGGTRYLLQTLFSDKKSPVYDHAKTADHKKENVVLLPGLTGDLGPYEELAEQLGDSFNVYSPGTLPRGLSAVLSRMSIDEQAKLLLEYLDRFENTDRTGKDMHLVGHSNGGLVALLALRMSEDVHNNRHRIGKIITIASGLKPPSSSGLGYIPGVSNYFGAVNDLRPESQLFSDISPYYGRVNLSLVSNQDQLFKPEMMYADPNRAKFYDVGHYGFFDKKHIGQTASDIKEAIDSCYSL